MKIILSLVLLSVSVPAFSQTIFDSECFQKALKKEGHRIIKPFVSASCKRKGIQMRKSSHIFYRYPGGKKVARPWHATAKVTVCGKLGDINDPEGVYLKEAFFKDNESESKFLSFTEEWPTQEVRDSIDWENRPKVCVSGYASLDDSRPYGGTLNTSFIGEDTQFDFKFKAAE